MLLLCLNRRWGSAISKNGSAKQNEEFGLRSGVFSEEFKEILKKEYNLEKAVVKIDIPKKLYDKISRAIDMKYIKDSNFSSLKLELLLNNPKEFLKGSTNVEDDILRIEKIMIADKEGKSWWLSEPVKEYIDIILRFIGRNI